MASSDSGSRRRRRRDHRGAKNGIASVQKNAPDATVVDLTE